jgi:hypothetical protein
MSKSSELKLGTAVNPLQVETNFPDGAVTAAKIDPGAFRLLAGSGADASVTPQAVTLTGTKVGDIVVGVVTAGGATVSADFESTITVADQIQQTAVDLSTAKIMVLLLATGT